MIKRIILLPAFMVLSAFFLLSCENKEDVQGEEKPFVQAKVRISPTISKVTETQFEQGDAIGVIIEVPSMGVYASNAKLVFDGTEFSGDLDWYDSYDACTIYAYYPYSQEDGPFMVQLDQSAGLSDSDQIVGSVSGVQPSASSVQMTFRHQMSRLEVIVNNNSGKILSGLKIGGITLDYNPQSEKVEIIPFVRDGKYYALIPPQQASITLSFMLDGEERTATVPNASYNRGAQHTITLTLDPETGALAALTGEIDGWVDHGNVFPSPVDFYDILKDLIAYSSFNNFSFCYFFMSELRADNVCQSGYSTADFTQYLLYENRDNMVQIWPIMDRMVNVTNSFIRRGAYWDAESAHRLGEAYFFRAFSHLLQVAFYARPYSIGKDDVFPLKTENGVASASVSDVYDHVVNDLLQAIELMSGRDDSSRDNGFVTTTAAKALLSRVYLYMEKNADCEAICNELLGSDPSQHLTADLANYFKEARSNPETIWCISYNADESLGKGSIGSLYYSPDGIANTGWCELYWSDPLIELFNRYPDDQRFKAFFSQYAETGDGTKMLYWPVKNNENDNYIDRIVYGLVPDSGGNITFSYDGQSYTAQKKSKAGVNNGYPQYFANMGGEDVQVFVRDNVSHSGYSNGGVRNGYPVFMMSKFSGQDGDSNLSSPVILRWAEVILNRAEARAKQGNISGALDDVNVIRRRAGLPEDAMMTAANYSDRGYSDILDVILDERRMEFCFEGHRYFDVYRNKKQMDRRYAGIHKWEVIDYTDSRIPYSIPNNQ